MLADRLAPEAWQRAEVPGQPPIALLDPNRVTTLAAKLRHTKAEHPEGAARPVVARAEAGARARIETLIAAIAAEPDDDGHREVLVDLLQELEDPGAPTFAALRAGSEVSAAKKKLALGPLAPFLVDVEYRRGLPYRAALSRSAPRDEASLAAAVADYRLGLLASFRIGLGNERVYTPLVAAARATALRDVDIPHPKTIAALVAVERTQLRAPRSHRSVEGSHGRPARGPVVRSRGHAARYGRRQRGPRGMERARDRQPAGHVHAGAAARSSSTKSTVTTMHCAGYSVHSSTGCRSRRSRSAGGDAGSARRQPRARRLRSSPKARAPTVRRRRRHR